MSEEARFDRPVDAIAVASWARGVVAFGFVASDDEFRQSVAAHIQQGDRARLVPGHAPTRVATLSGEQFEWRAVAPLRVRTPNGDSLAGVAAAGIGALEFVADAADIEEELWAERDYREAEIGMALLRLDRGELAKPAPRRPWRESALYFSTGARSTLPRSSSRNAMATWASGQSVDACAE